MLEQKQNLGQFQKIVEKYPEEVKEGLIKLQESAFKKYKEKGELPPLKGFFTTKEDKLTVFGFNENILPLNLIENESSVDNLLRKFKNYLEKSGNDILGFILIQQVWMKKVPINQEVEVEVEKSILEDPNKMDCLMFFIDSPDYSLTLIYEKIASGEDYVISPEPIEELYIDKKDPESPIKLEHTIYNFF